MALKLRFSPYAWAKLLALRDAGDSEVCGFGIGAADDALLVEDIALVPQTAGAASADLDDAGLAKFFDTMAASGKHPRQYARIFVHTHPGNSATPSGTDDETFQKAFGGCQWAVMLILAKGGNTYCRLRINCGNGGPCGQWDIPAAIYFEGNFPAVTAETRDTWLTEHAANVSEGVSILFPQGDYMGEKSAIGAGTCHGEYGMVPYWRAEGARFSPRDMMPDAPDDGGTDKDWEEYANACEDWEKDFGDGSVY